MNAAGVGGIQGIRALTSPVPGVDRRFERVFTLTLATGGEADAVALDVGSARLRGAFVARTFDALASVGLLRGVPLIAHPVNPALLVGLAGAQEAPVLVWAGAVEDTTAFDAGAALAGEIQRLLDALPTPLPPTVALALSARADESCAVKVEDIALPYELVTRRFAAIPLRRTDVADPAGAAGRAALPVRHGRGAPADPAGRRHAEGPGGRGRAAGPRARRSRRGAGGCAVGPGAVRGGGADAGGQRPRRRRGHG